MPLGKQGKRKAEKRSPDLGIQPPEGDRYVKPPPDECEDYDWAFDPSGGNMTQERIKVRLVTHEPTGWTLVEFAVVQQTKVGEDWQDVAMADSTHDDEAHVHRYGRVAGGRIGEPEHLKPITSVDDVQEGYNLAYDVIAGAWQENKRRWANA